MNMLPGTVVEYIDRKEIVCTVVMGQKGQRVHLLTEHDREMGHGEKRLSLVGTERLDLNMGRVALVERLQLMAAKRKHLQKQIDVEELWDVLHTESVWIDLRTMAEFCFDGPISDDHMSAVTRAMFEDRLYFKFDIDRFFPNSREKVAQIAAQAAEESRKVRLIEEGSRWVRQALEEKRTSVPPDKTAIIEILKSCYLFEKDSPDYKTGKAIMDRSGLDPVEGPFHLLVQLGVWDKEENLNLHRFGISETFPDVLEKAAQDVIAKAVYAPARTNRKDLTHLPTITIDGQGTKDFDDAISLEPLPNGNRLWVHITDVGQYLERGSPLDEEAMGRASSIYMPDKRIPMLPPVLAEGLCSLQKGKERLAISARADLDALANVVDYEIIPSIVRVSEQLTYYHANQVIQGDQQLSQLYQIAQGLRRIRMNAEALQLDLPEIVVHMDDEGEMSVTRINRESPSRVIISESMILANWLAARFFRDHGRPAVFRSQLPPRQRLVGQNGGTLYQKWMQRRFLSRVVLGLEAEPHAGLGLDAYLTCTSPLRKYLDLVTQRQMRALLGMEDPYSAKELEFIAQAVKEPLSYIVVLQQERTRYWILKYLEYLVGQEEKALVLERRRKRYVLLLTDYMLEATLPINHTDDLSPQDLVQVRIEHVDARSDLLTVSLV